MCEKCTHKFRDFSNVRDLGKGSVHAQARSTSFEAPKRNLFNALISRLKEKSPTMWSPRCYKSSLLMLS